MISPKFTSFIDRFGKASNLVQSSSWVDESGLYRASKPFASPLGAVEHAKRKRGIDPHRSDFVAASMSGTLGREYEDLRQGVSVVNTRQASAGTLVRVNSGRPLPSLFNSRFDHSVEKNTYGDIKMHNDYSLFDDITGVFNPQSYLDDPGTQQYPIVWHDLEARSLFLKDGVIEPLTIKGAMSVGTEIPFLAHGVKGDIMAGNKEPEDGTDLIQQYKEYNSGSISLEPFMDAQESAVQTNAVSARAIIRFLKDVRDKDAIVLVGTNGKSLKFEFDSGTNVTERNAENERTGVVRVDVQSSNWTPSTAPSRLATAINASGSFLGITATSASYGLVLTQDRPGVAGNTRILTLGAETSGSLVYDADDADAHIFTIAKSDTNVSGSGFFGGKNQFTLSAPGYTSDFVRRIIMFDDSYSMDPRGISVISGSIRDEGLISHNQKSSGAGFTYGNNPQGTDSLAFGDLSRS